MRMINITANKGIFNKKLSWDQRTLTVFLKL